MVNMRSRNLVGLVCLALPVLAIASTESTLSSEPIPTNADIICSTEDPTDCYPRLFEPTEEFQVIREGQDIPPGLHVQMDIYSGKKQARLNIPREGEDGSAEEGIMVVPPSLEDLEAEIEKEKPVIENQQPMNPPVYESAGKIQPPPPASDDYVTYQKAVMSISMDAPTFDAAMDELSDLAHDLYFGVEIAKDIPVLERLICFAIGLGSPKLDAKKMSRDRKAASILASAIQNNPTALKEVSKYWRFMMKPNCATLPENALRDKGDFVSTLRGGLGREKNAATLRAKVGAINGLIKDPLIRDEFIKLKGMELLLAIFLKKGEEFDGVRKKVGQLVMDNFLDEAMGAQLGVWPKTKVGSEKTCTTKGKMLKDGCWEHHIEAFSQRAPDEEWAKEFLESLKEERGKLKTKDREL